MKKEVVSVIGLGYVGLPVAVAFAQKYETIGFDINSKRINELKDGLDRTNEVTSDELKRSNISFTASAADLTKATFHIVTVPTPIDSAHRPDLTPLRKASETVGSILKKGDCVVYESTVYPGATREVCVSILEKNSGLSFGKDFTVGYSPERINPGDKTHRFENIPKVVSGSDESTLTRVADMYTSVIKAEIFKAPSLEVAEAAKVIENTQRDLNIALINELALIFNRMNIDTDDVLQAAATKWNFLKFRPGLVGGHCIGVDPYYLTHKAEELGYIPQVILAGRRVNDDMARFVAENTIKQLAQNQRSIYGSRLTILGVTFKEDCPDIRNSKVFDIISELKGYGLELQIHDPFASNEETMAEHGVQLTSWDNLKPAAAVVCAVAHTEYKNLSLPGLKSLMDEKPLLIDIKGLFARQELNENDIKFWRL